MEEYSNFRIFPVVNFIKKMFFIDNAEKAIKLLKIYIPETYWNDAEIFFVFNDPFKNKQLTLMKNKKDFNLFKTLENIEINQYKRCLGPIKPLYVMRIREKENIPKGERI